MIVPTYDKVRVTFLNVHKWVALLHQIADTAVFPSDELEWDIHLVGNNEFKHAAKREFPIEFRKPILLAQHPRFIWRIRLAVKGDIVMDLLADATDLERSMPIYCVIKTHAALSNQLLDILCEPSLSDPITKLLTEPMYSLMVSSKDKDVFIRETQS